MKPFDPFTLPGSGTSLIEASAGTGKTFGIAALFVRWVLLEKKSLTRLLVLTFTKAATAELKTRLRARLVQILRLLPQQTLPEHVKEIADDAFLQELFARLNHGDEALETLQLRVRAALDEFDGAGIYTIHAFCRSVLSDEAFLCGVPFTLETTENQEALINQLRDDFWRQQIATSEDAARLCFENALTPHTALTDIKPYLNSPYLHYDIPHSNWREAYAQLDAAHAQWKTVAANTIPPTEAAQIIENVSGSLSQSSRDKMEQALHTQYGMTVAEAAFWRILPKLNGSIYRVETFQKLFSALGRMQADGTEIPLDLQLKLPLLADKALRERCKKGQALTDNETAELVVLARLGEAYARYASEQNNALLAIRFKLLRFIDRQLAIEKRRSKQRSFADLLLDVHQALTASPYRERLAKRLAASWDALMVDEFQDTDPIQYEIFKTAFATHGIPVYLVGDPKQAIYRFRGADILTYLQATQDTAGQCYTLDVNWRSHRSLVAAIGALFSRGNPFVHEHIAYPEIRAARETGKLQPALKALTIFCLNEAQEKTPADSLHKRATDTCANHMAMVLNRARSGCLKLGERAFAAGDIAVLVRNHNEARRMMLALKQRGIRSVSLRRESVFASDEATALSALLHFWLNPQQTGLLRFVLASVLFAYTAADIDAFNRDDAAITRHIETAREALRLWQTAGIFAAYQYFNRHTNLEQGLIRRRAERTLTNLYQLLELTATTANEYFGERALLAWLEREITHSTDKRTDNTLLRLENDESLVKIITIHAAKGLQYPLVYYPFAYMVKTSDTNIEKIHHLGQSVLRGKNQLDENDKICLQQEQLSENLRLLYVALTRASEAVVLCCTDSAKAAPHKLPLDYLTYHDSSMSTWTAWQVWAQAANLPDAIELSSRLPDNTNYDDTAAATHHFQAAPAPIRNFGTRQLTSFSGWLRTVAYHDTGKSKEEFFAIDIAEQPPPPSPLEVENPHIFPAGIQAGLCWHAILEQFDFTRTAALQEALIGQKLTAYGFDAVQWGGITASMLDNVRQAGLGPNLTLERIPRRWKLAESGFLLNHIHFDPQEAERIFADSLPDMIRTALKHVAAESVSGFFNGFIDLIAQDHAGEIYLIDYKSNRLGTDSTDYTLAALDAAMAEHQYAVQALIYALATRRYLALRGRTPQTLHIRYLFLRGITAHTAQGIWSWEIDCGKLKQLDERLCSSTDQH